MRWLTDLVAFLGTHGAYTNASRSLAEEREVAAQLERFLIRFDHPAGRSRILAEPPSGGARHVA